jgi:NO-binding membrane sensor protein with MHYT domain
MQFPAPLFVFMAASIAAFGAWTGVDLFRRVHANVGRARIAWLTAASMALGAGLWAATVVWLLGLNYGGAGRMDGSVLALALALAMGGSGVCFTLMGRRGRDPLFATLGGAAAGIGAALADFVALTAVQDAVSVGYDLGALLISAAIAVVAVAGAQALGETGRAAWRRLASAVVVAAGAVAAEAYSVSALNLQPRAIPAPGGSDPFVVAATVWGVVLFVLFLACVAALFDRRFEGMAAIEAELTVRMQAVLERVKPLLERVEAGNLPVENQSTLRKMILASEVVCGRGVDWNHELKDWWPAPEEASRRVNPPAAGG